MVDKGKWWVEVHDNDTSIESEHQTIASDVSNEDADHIVDTHNKHEAFEAMEKALERARRELLHAGWEDGLDEIEQALKLAKGE